MNLKEKRMIMAEKLHGRKQEKNMLRLLKIF